MDIISSVRSKSINLQTKHKDVLFPRTRSDTAEYGSLIWKFDPDNHYLNETLIQLVYSKCVLRFIAIIAAVQLLMNLAIPGTISSWYFIVMSLLFYIPFLTMIILSFNRDAKKFIWKSSEFWIKLIYSIISPTLNIVHYHQVGWDGEVASFVGYMSCGINMIFTPMMMIIIGGFDAIPQMPHKWKVILGSMVAVQWSWMSLLFQLLVPESADYIVHVKMTGSRISFLSLQSSVAGMLAVFLWKELADIVRNPKRCIAITYKPYLEWERTKHGSELMRSASLPSIE